MSHSDRMMYMLLPSMHVPIILPCDRARTDSRWSQQLEKGAVTPGNDHVL
jgi:hypothetical protein